MKSWQKTVEELSSPSFGRLWSEVLHPSPGSTPSAERPAAQFGRAALPFPLQPSLHLQQQQQQQQQLGGNLGPEERPGRRCATDLKQELRLWKLHWMHILVWTQNNTPAAWMSWLVWERVRGCFIWTWSGVLCQCVLIKVCVRWGALGQTTTGLQKEYKTKVVTLWFPERGSEMRQHVSRETTFLLG